MVPNLENPSISFRKNTGKETAVKIISETLINNEGYFGDIFDTIVEVGGHKKRFIVKKYIGDNATAKRSAKHAFKNYSVAKKAGLKVFPKHQSKF